MDGLPNRLEEKLKAWNQHRPVPEAQMRVLFHDRQAGWAIAHKPAGLHACPSGKDHVRNLTFQDYLPALLPPPIGGTRCRGPRVCHRLDYRVWGPIVVATSQEAAKSIHRVFRQRLVKKEYRAIVCGRVGDEGQTLLVDHPLDGKDATTNVEVRRVVPCPHFGALSELTLRPLHGRFHQLRRHCAEALGTPIVNEDPPLWKASTPVWENRFGHPLPPAVRRARGNLFLQAVEVALPPPAGQPGTEPVVVGTEVSPRFKDLMDQSERAWNKGYRPDWCQHAAS